MSDDGEVRLHLTQEEGAAALLLIALGSSAYEGTLPNPEIIALLDRMPPKYLRGLKKKLEAYSETLDGQS
jgi:hypothetical protein